jgi:hypothetical protein
MSRNRRERGEGNFGCLIGIVVLLIAALIAYKLIPIKVKTADMRDTVMDEARSAGAHKDGQIRAAILNKAKQLNLPIGDENVKVRRQSGIIYVDVEYTVPVEFPGYTYNWHFRHKTDNPIF